MLGRHGSGRSRGPPTACWTASRRWASQCDDHENRADYGTHHNNLQAHLAAGSGTADIEVIEIGQIAGYLGQGDKFVNFNDQGVDPETMVRRQDQAGHRDRRQPHRPGTDIGGLAICYRTDLFKAAGLPTDREAVGKLWPTWDDYVKAGSDFIAKTPDKKVSGMTAPTTS